MAEVQVTPAPLAVETPQQKLDRELAEFNARKIADAKIEQEQARLAAEKEAYAKSPDGLRAAARDRELVLQANREFLTAHPDFSDTDQNAAEIRSYLKANQLTWSAANLATAYEAQWRAGKLTPKPFIPPPADAPKPFDTQGMTLARFKAMPGPDARRYYSTAKGKAIIDHLTAGGN